MKELLLKLFNVDDLVKEQHKTNELLEEVLRELKRVRESKDASNKAYGIR